jgi:tRNA threonylcarbamoyladenosine biosynthesis protein TsaB
VLVLILDTATAAVTAALATVDPDAVVLLATEQTVDALGHAERLAPAVRTVLARAGAEPHELAAVVAGLGPGPFTGLRVGLVTAAALGQALGRPTYGVCSLDGLGAATSGRVVAATDARRREVYWAAYQDGRRIGEPAVSRPGDLAAQLSGMDIRQAVGDGALRYADVLAAGAPGLRIAEQPRYPRPDLLAARAADRIRRGAPGEVLTPLYLRRPDAVEAPGAARVPG